MAVTLDVQSKRCWVEIDLAALERNLKSIRAALPANIRYVSVVKADAYGHGFQQTVTRLMQAGADIFAVANIQEAKQVEELGSGWPILILSPLLPDERQELIQREWIITLSSKEEVDALLPLYSLHGRPFLAHLKIDTGMGRVGVWHEEAADLYAYILTQSHIQLTGVYTHFSSADTDPGFTKIQRERLEHFLDETDLHPSSDFLIHADNSAGIATLEDASRFNAVRIGLLQFGIQPYKNSALSRVEVENVCHFKTKVALTKELPAGTPISYGRSFVLKEKTRIAVISAGYADGIPFPSSGSGEVIVRGEKCRILGRVTMDQTIIDVTHVPEVKAGDVVTLVGSDGNSTIPLQDFSRHGNTIPWEIMTSITKRVQRVYKTARNL